MKNIKVITNLDQEVYASGFKKKDLKDLKKFNRITENEELMKKIEEQDNSEEELSDSEEKEQI